MTALAFHCEGCGVYAGEPCVTVFGTPSAFHAVRVAEAALFAGNPFDDAVDMWLPESHDWVLASETRQGYSPNHN